MNCSPSTAIVMFMYSTGSVCVLYNMLQSRSWDRTRLARGSITSIKIAPAAMALLESSMAFRHHCQSLPQVARYRTSRRVRFDHASDRRKYPWTIMTFAVVAVVSQKDRKDGKEGSFATSFQLFSLLDLSFFPFFPVFATASWRRCRPNRRRLRLIRSISPAFAIL